MNALVLLSSALICFQGPHDTQQKCYHILEGSKTPIGVYEVRHMKTPYHGYGGDVLVFKETENYALAIHRVWLGNPNQHRQERLNSNNPDQRKNITNGCINVSPEIFDELVANHLETLEIRN